MKCNKNLKKFNSILPKDEFTYIIISVVSHRRLINASMAQLVERRIRNA